MIINSPDSQETKNFEYKLDEESLYDNIQISSCPRCKSTNFIKFGHSGGLQRYQCKCCKRTFSAATNSVFKYSKYPPKKWFEFLKLMLKNKTLSQCSEILNIHISTSFSWRHKILHAMEHLYTPEMLGGDVVFMKINYSQINRKGSKNINLERAESNCGDYSTILRDMQTVISYNNNNCGFVKTIGTSMICKKNFREQIDTAIDKNTYIKPSFNYLIGSEVVKHNNKLPLKKRKQYDYNHDKKMRYFSNDNIKDDSKFQGIIPKLRQWLMQFNGVASKYLDHYCNGFFLKFIGKISRQNFIFLDLLSKGMFTNMKGIKLIHPTY